MKSELLAALIHKPKILFLDEPTLGLDINAQRNLRKFLKAYNKETNATICLTSHYMKDITSLCKRVICVHNGSISYDGTLNKLLKGVSTWKNLLREYKVFVWLIHRRHPCSHTFVQKYIYCIESFKFWIFFCTDFLAYEIISS